jgi:hypothetical protein
VSEYGCHEWRDVAEIGEWFHNLLGGRASEPKSVRAIVETELIWERHEDGFTHEVLTALIVAAGRRIDRVYALSATTLEDGRISLDNGIHRWSVAVELGIERVPVKMHYLSSDSAWAPDGLSEFGALG